MDSFLTLNENAERLDKKRKRYEEISIFRLKIHIFKLQIRIFRLKIYIFNLKIENSSDVLNF